MAFVKDPNAVLDYTVDWSSWLVSGDTISVSVWVVPAGITKDSDTSNTTEATVWLSGGTVGLSYRLTNRITTTDGRTDERSLTVAIKDL